MITAYVVIATAVTLTVIVAEVLGAILILKYCTAFQRQFIYLIKLESACDQLGGQCF